MRPLRMIFTFSLLLLVVNSSSAQRKGQRINRFSLGATYGQIVSSDYKIGYLAGFTNSRPLLLNRLQRRNGNPLLYINWGLSLFSTGGKNVTRIQDDTVFIPGNTASLMYAALPLSIDLNIYNSRSSGQVKSSNNSFISLVGGAQFAYAIKSSMSGAGDYKSHTSPYDLQWFAGIRLLGTVNGISLDLDYYKGTGPVYSYDKASRNQFFVLKLTLNRMESGCSTSNRKRGHLFAV